MAERMRVGRASCVEREQKEHRTLGDQVYSEYYHVIVRYFQSHGCCLSDAEDLTQNVFTRFLRCARAPEDSRTYIFAMAKNQLRSYWRDRTRRDRWLTACTSREECSFGEVTFDLDPAGQSQIVEEYVLVQEAIRRLPPAMAHVLQLQVMSDLSVDEIARSVGCSHEAAKKRLQRAKRFIRDFCERANGGHASERCDASKS